MMSDRAFGILLLLVGVVLAFVPVSEADTIVGGIIRYGQRNEIATDK